MTDAGQPAAGGRGRRRGRPPRRDHRREARAFERIMIAGHARTCSRPPRRQASALRAHERARHERGDEGPCPVLRREVADGAGRSGLRLPVRDLPAELRLRARRRDPPDLRELAKLAPVTPIIGSGTQRIQPIWVGRRRRVLREGGRPRGRDEPDVRARRPGRRHLERVLGADLKRARQRRAQRSRPVRPDEDERAGHRAAPGAHPADARPAEDARGTATTSSRTTTPRRRSSSRSSRSTSSFAAQPDGGPRSSPLGGSVRTARPAMLIRFVLGLTGKSVRGLPRPDRERRGSGLHRLFYGELSESRECSPRAVLPLASGDLREHVLAQDADLRERQHARTARDLAAHGFDTIMREAWEEGVVLGRLQRRDDLLVRGRRHRLVRPAACGDARRPRLPPRQRRARTTTARSGDGRSTRSSSRADSRPGSRRTMRSDCTSSERSCKKPSRPGGQPRLPCRARQRDADRAQASRKRVGAARRRPLVRLPALDW